MKRLRQLIHEIHRRSLWQVLGTYLVAGWVAYEVVHSLTEGLGLPDWFPALAFVLLIVGLPIVLATAFIQEGGPGTEPPEAEIAAANRESGPYRPESTSLLGLLTWKRTLGGGIAVFAVAALIAAGSRIFGGVSGVTWSGVEGDTSASPAVRRAGDVIAVLPFRTSGSGLEHLEEGLMDLLSRGLAQADVIATIDPRTVMSRLREIDPDGIVDVTQARSIGSMVGATSVLLGSAVSVGPEVRLDAVLYSTRSDSSVTAQATGSPDSLLALADELAVALVQEVWASSAPIPNLDAGAVTTRSPAALRAFLEGERLYRLADLRGSRRMLEEAVQFDTTFALANHRLGWVLAWTEGLNAPSTLRRLRTAARHSNRLPVRERTLVQGFLLLAEDRLEDGYRLLSPYVARWPDDPEAWMLMANYQYHHPDWMGRNTDQVLALFDRVIALDSTLTMAYVHPVQVALHNRDRALYERYTAPLLRFATDASPRVGRLLDMGQRCFGGSSEVEPVPPSQRLSGYPRRSPSCDTSGGS